MTMIAMMMEKMGNIISEEGDGDGKPKAKKRHKRKTSLLTILRPTPSVYPAVSRPQSSLFQHQEMKPSLFHPGQEVPASPADAPLARA